MSNKSLVVALVGNPNSGKTTLFNHLTGKQQEIGNWCGVTVEKKQGWFQEKEVLVEIIDLPGCYNCVSTTESAIDEQITTEYLASRNAELIINVIDATNLERHLYLTLQLLERNFPIIVVLNMMDAANRVGMNIDIDVLAKQLGCPVIPLVAVKKQGIQDLKKAIINYKTRSSIQSSSFLTTSVFTGEQEIALAKARYDLIRHILNASITRSHDNKPNWTERIDRFILNRFLGIPLFLLLMYFVFVFAIHIGGSFQDFFDMASKAICIDGMSQWLALASLPDWLVSLIAFGFGQGINTTVSFIPVIAAMFFSLSFLEASGYMARAAFVMDRVMQWAGLPGKSFVPMIIGFGCNVPAVMAGRTLENYRERILTILMSPFMSCSARLAIYAFFVSAFFRVGGQNIIFGLYLIGILIALFTGFVLRTTVLSGERSALIIELPPYRWPKLRALYKKTWQRLKRFVLKAGAIIIFFTLVISGLGIVRDRTGMDNWLAVAGRYLTPIFKPMGIKEDNWPATIGLLTGILAKEVVVGTLNALYVQEAEVHRVNTSITLSVQDGLRQAFKTIPDNWSRLGERLIHPLSASAPKQELNEGVLEVMVNRFGSAAAAFAYLLFVLLYFPCISVVATMAKELNRYWALFSVVWTTSIAYITAVLFYQGTMIYKNPVTSITWILGIVSFLLAGFYGIRKVIQHKLPVRVGKPLPTQILVLEA